ncbi:MAG TPA: metallophosphoesterase [Terriglobales bacterium]|nr:metallophosphoesterase [Terriglobales bacterium]
MNTRWNIRSLIPVLVATLSLGCMDCSHAPQATGPATVQESQSLATGLTQLPNAKDSFKFVVLGDFGDGTQRQYDLAQEMARTHEKFPFETVITVGDNLYGRQRASDFQNKFEIPYKPLLDAGVKFYASLGNHDIREQPSYKLFNMNGKLFYSFKAPQQSVRFFFLDSNYMSPEQVAWIGTEMKGAGENWKFAVFHHPLYSSGGRHGSDVQLRKKIEPLLIENNVSVVFSGHDHFYERIKPQNGIIYFVCGSGGELAIGDIRPNTGLTEKGFDRACTFMAVEIVGDKMYFNAIMTGGGVVDSGIIERGKPIDSKAPQPAAQAQKTPNSPHP